MSDTPISLHATPVNGWPKLAWVAQLVPGRNTVHVMHGPMVETAPDWCVEAVWAGEFTQGGFDQTDLVYGTGLRCRDGKLAIVSSATGVDRLWHAWRQGRCFVSNSLPALLATAGLSLRDDYTHYSRDLQTVESRGMTGYTRALPVQDGEVNVLYFRNLLWDGNVLSEVDKPVTTPHFACFDDYHAFLVDTGKSLGANLASPARRNSITPLASISSGYDSPAAAVVARHCGCTQAVTIGKSNSLWRGSDSGEEIARHLKLDCKVYELDPDRYRNEVTIWAAVGVAGGLNLTLFDYPKPLCLFFNGSYGDKVWDRFEHELGMDKIVGDRDSFLCEFRLIEGIFHTVVPWWGIARAQEINALGAREEMRPWTLGTRYDRPVARRIVEQAGVPRETFGIRKKNASSNASLLWPYSPQAQESLDGFLRQRGMTSPSAGRIRRSRRLAHIENLLHLNVWRKLGVRRRWRPWSDLDDAPLIQWGNHELVGMYRSGLADVKEGQP